MKYLEKIDRIFLFNAIQTVFTELLDNALKAVVKRTFFLNRGYDIYDEGQHNAGVKELKSMLENNSRVYHELLEESSFNIKIRFEITPDLFVIHLMSNTAIVPEEMKRIRKRLDMAGKAVKFMDIQKDISDNSEGAGMGLVLALFVLKNIGVDTEALTIGNNGGSSFARLEILRNVNPQNIINEIKDRILEEIDLVPTFPENIKRLQEMCDDPDSTIEKISLEIQKDPGLSADIVKLSNTAQFIKGKRTYNVTEALKIIGLKRLREILSTISARNILNSCYPHFEYVWDHCNRVATYMQALSREFRLDVDNEDLLIAGLLHDLGKLILLSIEPELGDRIMSIVTYKKAPLNNVFEEASLGISHSHIGGLIATRWNFPDYLIEAINHHHSPHLSADIFQDVVYAVYLANMLCGIDDKNFEYQYIDDYVLERFGLHNVADVRRFHEELRKKIEALP